MSERERGQGGRSGDGRAEMAGGLNRREAMQLLLTAPLALAFPWTPAEIERAARAAGAALERMEAGQSFRPRFFTPHEWETVRILVDLIIPPDERSGGATDAGVPEFMDFMMMERTGWQTEMRGGLAWLDHECRRRFDRRFIDCDDDQRAEVLDDIAWPDRAPPELGHGVEFFNGFRDLTASGFWSSRMGVADLGYEGNTVVPEWTGCPGEQLRRLGVEYEDGEG